MLFEWDPQDIVVTFGDVIAGGFAPDTFVSWTENVDAFSIVVGAGGDATRVASLDRTSMLTLTLQEGSPTNDELSAIHASDRKFKDGIKPCQISRVGGSTLIRATKAFIVRYPDAPMGAAAPTREWKILLVDTDATIGGSEQVA